MLAVIVRALAAVAGAGLIALVVFDVVTTTLAVGSGGGPLTRRVGRWLWQASHRLWPASHVAPTVAA